MFCRANIEEVKYINNIILDYQNASGQLVNVNKSEIMFSKHVKEEVKRSIHQILHMQQVEQFSKYLGMPTYIGRSKNQTFQFLQDKVWKKLKGWKEKHLSFAGRATLIKAVAQAIPTYIMSSFLLPKSFCDHMESQICKFWWGNNVDKRKIHWVNWKKTCKAKSKGGMGFKNLRAFNEALLAKQGWRLITNPQSLVARMFKAKYYPQCDFLKAKRTQNWSFSWQSIQKSSWILKKGCVWQIGDGKSINIWEDRWINPKAGSFMWSKKPDNSPLQRVSDLIDEETKCWKEHVINQNFYPMEATQIFAIPLTNTNSEDIISWYGTKDGNYSVKSGYHAIMEWNDYDTTAATSSHNDMETRWKKLWSLAVPPKQTHLIWRILDNALPVKENLLYRGIRCAPFCSYCGTKLETINHIFMECDWARKAWFTCPFTINMENVKLKTVNDWIDYMIQTAKTEDVQVISAIMYGIWLARNDREFNNKCLPPDEVVCRAMKSLHEYQANQHARVPERTIESGDNDTLAGVLLPIPLPNLTWMLTL
jgi:hypothetical protein